MAKAIRGINRIVLMRTLSANATDNAGRLTFQTEHEKASSRESTATATKDGNVVSLSEETVSFSLSTILAQDDETRDKLETAYHNGELIEIWDINKSEKIAAGEGAGKFPATYYQGYVTEWTESAPVDGDVTLSISVAVNGAGAKGFTELSAEQEAVAQYEYTDTKKKGA